MPDQAWVPGSAGARRPPRGRSMEDQAAKARLLGLEVADVVPAPLRDAADQRGEQALPEVEDGSAGCSRGLRPVTEAVVLVPGYEEPEDRPCIDAGLDDAGCCFLDDDRHPE